MYAYLEGQIDYYTDNILVLDVGGVGYEINMPTPAISTIAKRGEVVRVYTYFHVSENGIGLYGFLNREDKELFLMLISVNGVGPKAAMAILGSLSSDDLRFAILAEDEKAISKAPGIGPKSARRIILDLKDKIDVVSAVESRLSGGDIPTESSERNDAVMALVALGYSSSEALKALSGIDEKESMTSEDMIREALKRLI